MAGWRRTSVALLCCALASSPALTGCADPVDGPSLVLTLATSEEKTEPNAPAIQEFAHQVDVRSGGTIRIDVAWNVTNPTPAGSDQIVARAVADGEYDLGVLPTRVWDLLGVTSLRALNTPFLVTSEPALHAVLAADVRNDLLSDLPSAGVVGIDLWPGELRRFFGFRGPLLRPADFVGQKIRSPKSETVWKLIDALGATPVETPTAEPRHQTGLESSFSVAGYGLVATGNVVIFPRVESLVADDDVSQRLRPDQWRLLVESAAATRRDQIASLPSDADVARAFCAKGDSNTIVAASPSDVAAIEKVGSEVRRELERDQETATLIEEIEAVVATVPEGEPLTACPALESTPASDTEESALNGIYTSHVTRRDFIEAGATDPERIRDNSGRFTWTIKDGLWSAKQRADHYLTDTELYGQYELDGDHLTWYWGDGQEVVTARIRRTANGTIHFDDVHDNNDALQLESEGFFSNPFIRVGDLPD